MAVLHELAQVGGKESLSNLITLVDVVKTPFVSALRKGKKLINTEHKTQVKKYKRTAFKGVMSTADVKTFTNNGRKQLKMNCEIFRDATGVSTLVDQVVEVDGLTKSEMAEQIVDSLAAVKLQKEMRYLSGYDSSEDDGDSVPNKTRGIFSWGSPTAQTHNPVPDGYRPAAGQQHTGTLAALTEDAFLDMLEAAYNSVGGTVALDFHCGIALKRAFALWNNYSENKANFTAVRISGDAKDSKTVSRMVNFLDTDMGQVRLIPNANILCDEDTGETTDYSSMSGVGFDPSMFSESLNKNAAWNKLENQGGGPRGYVDEIAALLCDNPLAIITAKVNSAA